MKIVFIGPDGAGKSTIAKEWSEKLNMPVIENDYREPDKLTKMYELLELENVIFDRLFYPDHLVYSKIKGHELSEEELKAWDDLRLLLPNENIVYIYVTATDELLYKRLNSRGDEYIEFEDIPKIKEEYEKILKDFPVPIMTLESQEDYSYKAGGPRSGINKHLPDSQLGLLR